ncbi:MAG TPA: CpsB/CapC family capsule biosynthesis tyrosine phosphatase [Solirubrobacteraceae bacterium]|nr:CpsB/CapC family capsule biosynthesis tyrosine phosphatase [Solirubrobacteraceae bacterium]
MGFAELHFHLLPGVDDGPRTLAESLALAAAAVADGTELVVTTPHIRRGMLEEPREVAERVAELTGQLRREGIPLAVRAGGELSFEMVAKLSDAQLNAIAHGPPIGRWVLLESPFTGRDESFTLAADELRARGFAVVLAHPERTTPDAVSMTGLRHELRAGSALQLNAWSVTGRYGEDVRDRALALLRSSATAAIASDAHGGERMPWLTPAIASLTTIGDRNPRRRFDAIPWGLLSQGVRFGRGPLEHDRAA